MMETPLILLHGAVGAEDQLEGLREILSVDREVRLFTFPGHGGIEMAGGDFSIAGFAESLRMFIEVNGWERVDLFGYSMGGYVALYLAGQYPGLVNKVITLATKFHWDEAVAAKEVRMLDPGTIMAKVPAFAEVLQKRHHPLDWRMVLSRTTEMMRAMGADNPLKEADYCNIQLPVLVMLGDRDKMVGFEETLAVYKRLPDASLCILPGTPHPIEQVDQQLLATLIRSFLE